MANDEPALVEDVEMILMFMTLSEEMRISRVPLRQFRSPVPLLTGRVQEMLPAGEDVFLDPYDFTIEDYEGLDFTVLAPDPDDGRYNLRRVRHVRARDVRGKVQGVSRYMVENLVGKIDPKRPENEYFGARAYFGHSGGMWRRLRRTDGIGGAPSPGGNIREDAAIRVLKSVQFTSQWWWMATIGWEGCPSITLPTDALGAREVFRLRDIPEGRSRRAAIRHWVSSHWRKRRTDPEEEVRVRRHLRGGTTFTWNNLHVRLRPSVVDLEQAERHREEPRATRKRRAETRGPR